GWFGGGTGAACSVAACADVGVGAAVVPCATVGCVVCVGCAVAAVGVVGLVGVSEGDRTRQAMTATTATPVAGRSQPVFFASVSLSLSLAGTPGAFGRTVSISERRLGGGSLIVSGRFGLGGGSLIVSGRFGLGGGSLAVVTGFGLGGGSLAAALGLSTL